MKFRIFARSFLLFLFAVLALSSGFTTPTPPPIPPGTDYPTSATGWMMKAKLNGKEWEAMKIASLSETGRIVGLRGEESISLPFAKSKMITGRTIKLSANWVVDLVLKDEVGLWGANQGEITFTKVDQNSAEGTFSFIATDFDKNKKLTVTEGTFRILLGKK